MLPDFPKMKEKLNIMIDYELKRATLLHLGPLADIRETILFEGSKTVINHDDGSVSDIESKEFSVMLKCDMNEIETMTHKRVLEKIDHIAKEMAEKQATFSYERIGEFAEEVGNVVSAEGKTFSIEHFFEVLEKIDMDFDENGNPIWMKVVMSPELYYSAAKVLEQAKDDPEIDKRLDSILERKREEWCVRESNRKLVG